MGTLRYPALPGSQEAPQHLTVRCHGRLSIGSQDFDFYWVVTKPITSLSSKSKWKAHEESGFLTLPHHHGASVKSAEDAAPGSFPSRPEGSVEAWWRAQTTPSLVRSSLLLSGVSGGVVGHLILPWPGDNDSLPLGLLEWCQRKAAKISLNKI